MAKVKLKDKEIEVDDELAGLVADETGVPFRNRAAESRRKQEKLEKEFNDYKETQAAKLKELESRTQAAPYTPGVYQNPNQAYYNPQTGQVFYPNQQNTGLSAEDARRIAREEASRERAEREYHEEKRKLETEWSSYDDEKDEVKDYLRDIGYEENQIESFGPRDLRLVKDAFKGRKQPKPNKRNPQEVILDTGGGEGYIESDDSPWKTGSIDKLDKAGFEKLVAETKMKPRIDDLE